MVLQATKDPSQREIFLKRFIIDTLNQKPLINVGDHFQVTCTEHLALGIDQNGKLKKLPIADLSARTDWKDVLSHGTAKNEEEVEAAKFVKVSSSEHSVIALDESGIYSDNLTLFYGVKPY